MSRPREMTDVECWALIGVFCGGMAVAGLAIAAVQWVLGVVW